MDILNQKRCDEMIQKTGPLVESAFKLLKYDLGGKVPADFSMGFVAGYLKGNGMTLEESMFGAGRFYEIILKNGGVVSEVGDYIIKIRGSEDASAKIEMEPKKEKELTLEDVWELEKKYGTDVR